MGSRTRRFLPEPVLRCPEAPPPPLSPSAPLSQAAHKPSGPSLGLPVTIRLSESPCTSSVHRACPLPACCLYEPNRRDLHPVPRPPLIVFLMSHLPPVRLRWGGAEAVWSTRGASSVYPALPCLGDCPVGPPEPSSPQVLLELL